MPLRAFDVPASSRGSFRAEPMSSATADGHARPPPAAAAAAGSAELLPVVVHVHVSAAAALTRLCGRALRMDGIAGGRK
jgi:hypothetical protein